MPRYTARLVQRFLIGQLSPQLLAGSLWPSATSGAVDAALARVVHDAERQRSLMGQLAASTVGPSAAHALRVLVEGGGLSGAIPAQLKAFEKDWDLLKSPNGALGPYHMAALAAAYTPYRVLPEGMALGSRHHTGLRATHDAVTLAGLSREFTSLAAVAQRTADIQSVTAQFTASARQIQKVGWTPGLSAVADVARRLDRLGAAVGRVWEDFAARPELLPSLPMTIREAPTLQLYSAARVTVLVIRGTTTPDDVAGTVGAGAGVVDATADTAQDLWLNAGGDLSTRLEAVGAGLGQAFVGAVEALRRRGPDYMRHVAVSLRELLDKLFSILASDSAVRSWWKPGMTVDLFVPGTREISRAARLAYLFRGVSAAYATFVSGDQKFILQTFYALNDATHHVPVPFDDADVTLLVERVKGHLNTLLCIADR